MKSREITIMSTMLRCKTQYKQKADSRKRNPLPRTQSGESYKKHSDDENKKVDPTSRKVKSRKSLSGSHYSSGASLTTETRLAQKESEDSIIYVGTTYINVEMPRKESIIDLTKSDTTIISWDNHYNCDNYDISGDNIIDEIHLKDQVSSAASIFTILPPQPQNVFSSPSDELCICQTAHQCRLVSSKKRNLSASDITYYANTTKPKRVASSRSKVTNDRINPNESSDCVWKLKRTYPLTGGLHANVVGGEVNILDEIPCDDIPCDIDILDIVDDLEKEFNITNSQQL